MGKFRIIGGRNGRIWPEVLKTARAARDAGRPVIVYVPEQLTLQTERDLISGLALTGLLNMDVISPKKLRLQVRETAGGSRLRLLDDFGRTMAVQRAMTETSGELAYYRDMNTLPGAVSRVKEALGELLESDVTGEELARYARDNTSGAEQARLGDLARIWAAYDGLTAGRFEDEKTAWTDMVNRLEQHRMWEGAEILVYGFDSVRPDLRELLVHVAPQAGAVSVFLLMDQASVQDGAIYAEQRRSADRLEESLTEEGIHAEREWLQEDRPGQREALAWLDRCLFARDDWPWDSDPAEDITLFAGANPTEETRDIAKTLLAWHREGIAWNRMAVALPGGCGLDAALRARLKLSGIPFFCAEKTAAASHGVCRMLGGALACISDGYRTDTVLSMARSGFASLAEDEARQLENYALAHGIERNMWQAPFLRGEEAGEMEILRQKLVSPVEHLREELKNARNAAESVEAVVRFLEAEDCWQKLQAREEALLKQGMYREAVVDRQVWQMLMNILDQLWALLGDRRASIREMRHLLDTAMSSAEIAVLPEEENGVIIGEVGHMLSGEVDALILPGATEGILTVPESGWITDRERETLENATGSEIGLSRQQRSLIRRCDYYRTLTLPKRKLRLTRSLRDENGRVLPEDGLIGIIRRIFPKMEEEGSVLDSGISRPETPLKAMEDAGGFLDALQAGENVSDEDKAEWEKALVALLHSSRYGGAAGELLRTFRGEGGGQAILPETARRLFMTDQVSISRLERFAECPYKHFMDYGLRPVHSETFEFENTDAGTFFHAALDRYMRTGASEPGWPALDREETNRIMDDVIRELTAEWADGPLREDAIGVWQGENLTRRVRYAAWALTRFAANSDFRTIATEQSFGSPDSPVPPLILRMADGSSAAVRGTIDRIDMYENGEGLWLRVVDNKSSDKKPEPEKMETGEQLQLMIYLQAAAKAYPEARPAGAMFFPVQDKEINTDETDPEKLEDTRLSKVRMKGLVAAERDVVRAMDRDIAPFSVDQVFNKDGSVSKKADWAVDEETLQGLMNAAEEKAAELCDEIRAGRVEAAPRGDEKQSACTYCDYRTVCHARPEDTRQRNTGVTWRTLAKPAEN